MKAQSTNIPFSGDAISKELKTRDLLINAGGPEPGFPPDPGPPCDKGSCCVG